jgi:hypothetical protein
MRASRKEASAEVHLVVEEPASTRFTEKVAVLIERELSRVEDDGPAGPQVGKRLAAGLPDRSVHGLRLG